MRSNSIALLLASRNQGFLKWLINGGACAAPDSQVELRWKDRHRERLMWERRIGAILMWKMQPRGGRSFGTRSEVKTMLNLETAHVISYNNKLKKPLTPRLKRSYEFTAPGPLGPLGKKVLQIGLLRIQNSLNRRTRNLYTSSLRTTTWSSWCCATQTQYTPGQNRSCKASLQL